MLILFIRARGRRPDGAMTSLIGSATTLLTVGSTVNAVATIVRREIDLFKLSSAYSDVAVDGASPSSGWWRQRTLEHMANEWCRMLPAILRGRQ